MKLWKLAKRDDFDQGGKLWGTCRAFVVRAETEEDARRHAYLHSVEYGVMTDGSICFDLNDAEDAWLNPLHTTCDELHPEGVQDIIVRDFYES